MDSIHAIYEDGVFKPVEPVSLPERTEVRVTVPEKGPVAREAPDQEVVAKRQAALRELFEKINADPRCAGSEDGWSAANNVDEVLYGGADGPA